MNLGDAKDKVKLFCDTPSSFGHLNMHSDKHLEISIHKILVEPSKDFFDSTSKVWDHCCIDLIKDSVNLRLKKIKIGALKCMLV